MNEKLKGISRRDFMRVAGRYGLTSTLFAAAGATGMLTLPQLAKAAEETSNERGRVEPKFRFKFGASGFNENNLDIQKSGQLFFARDLEERTDGAIQVEFIGSNQICGQLDCVTNTQQGIIEIFSASTQNSAGGAPYYNALDFAYMFPSRASQYYFFYHPKSEALLREPLRQRHNIQFLFTHCELRGMMMGASFRDKPLVTSVDDLRGTANRVTGTQLGRIAMQQLDLNPRPVAWAETLDALRSGLIDGAETWMGAVAYAGMSGAISQAVDLKFFCGTEHTAMSWEAFQKLPSDLQDAVMESAYTAQVHVQGAHEAALYDIVGAYPDPAEHTLFAQNNVRVALLSDAEIKKAEEMCSPEYNPEPWARWRERINGWSGGHDVYKEIYDIAREIDTDMSAVNVKPRRWWKAA
ncbi:TRAP-type C4-dicarboxylate transport system substrate-binding protein [Natronocella acetinitrilica]|uniref:TRAP-type C4-dicarboxylate transport system substrate-binding protein n=1 Tax=Natronocella acetinitrilica TaxID=414046 RepID=A0AAE3G712_9GAMM|nr:TRAP transporter substrate-binding protein DctP [Natronocella acetinitrilica]MCP1676965.1 TRAP-type C4-dicarboxylate transport system substrate-binding protein [Natronocella acetinitrilica]